MTSVGISVDHIRMIFLTNFYHSFGSHHSQSFLGRLSEKLTPEHPPFPNIGCPMSPPSFFPSLLLPLDPFPPLGCQPEAFPHPSHPPQETRGHSLCPKSTQLLGENMDAFSIKKFLT